MSGVRLVAVCSALTFVFATAPAMAQTPPSPSPNPVPTASAQPSPNPVPTQKPPEPTPKSSHAPSGASALTTNPLGAPSDKEDAVPYPKFIATAEKQDGLFTIWRARGKVFFELTPEQFNRDFIQTAVPANGLGGYGVTSGQVFFQEARIFRFERDGRRVSLIWPPTRFLAAPNTALSNAVAASTASSVIGEAPVISENPVTHGLVIEMSALLGDVMNLTDVLNQNVAEPHNPLSDYHLDPTRTHFGPAKAFPKNVIVEADQTFASMQPKVIDTVVDPRSVQLRVKYNVAELQASPDYMPRLIDDRVGYFEDAHIDFSRELRYDPFEHFVTRWNLKPSDPSKAISPAVKPIVYTLSNTIPEQYRAPVRAGILAWNAAFARIGISDAVKVQDQPNDPNFDPDDIRYNVVRWLTESNSGGFAEAQLLWNPRTGELFRSGVLLDNDLVSYGKFEFEDVVGPASSNRPLSFAEVEARGSAQAHQQFLLGAIALDILQGRSEPWPQYINDFLKAIVLHEVGHDFGLQHNFIGHMAYTAAQIHDKRFTSRYGVASSVMEYAPVNLSPKHTRQGSYWQTVLGPYDYYAIHWGYARVPGAKSPQDEVPTLSRWASAWSNPMYRFASDEDVDWPSGHAVDPRVEQFMLTNDPISWCGSQLNLYRGLIGSLDKRFPRAGQPYQSERESFGTLLGGYNHCATVMSHYIGGEHLSRARRGDPRATPPLTPISRSEERRAYGMLDRYLFSDAAWRFSPNTLRHLVYEEHSGFNSFGYDPSARHDVSVAQQAARFQNRALAYMFNPLTLQRIADLPSKSEKGATMSMADLFSWTQSSIFGDVGRMTASTQVHRNLQRRYANVLSTLVLAPPKGTPYDAQSLARYELTNLSAKLKPALRNSKLDLQTQAHYSAMLVDVSRALDARIVVPTGDAPTR